MSATEGRLIGAYMCDYQIKGGLMFRKILLFFAMLIISSSVFAQTAVEPVGAGTTESPYEISSLENLYWLTQWPDKWSAEFIQTADIDASTTIDWDGGAGFIPLGNTTVKFTGKYDGQGHVITGLTINRPTEKYIGFFGIIENGTIQNVGLENVSISGGEGTGALVGWLDKCHVDKCFTTGNIICSNMYSGGLVGYSYPPGGSNSIYQCYSECDILLNGEVRSYSGGLVGYSFSVLRDCYAKGNITGGTDRIGGLAGQEQSQIIRCYAVGSVEGTTNIGGLIGAGSPYVSNSFWNVDTDGIPGNVAGATNNGAIGRSTLQMKSLEAYTKTGTAGLDWPWDFVDNPYDDTNNEDIYNMDGVHNEGYPFHAWKYSLKPVIFTNLVASITTTSFVLNGEITKSNGATITERGFVYSITNSNPVCEGTGVTSKAAGSGVGSFSATISSLQNGTTYYYRSYAKTSTTVVYGEIYSVTTNGVIANNGALKFDGINNYAQLQKLLPLGNSSFTIELWIKVPEVGTDNLAENQRVGVILGNWPDAKAFNFEIFDAGQIRFYWNNGVINYFGKKDYRDNKWHHIACVRDREHDKVLLYHDGELAETFNSAGGDVNIATLHKLGNDNRETGNPYFHGEMDELRIWNKVKSSFEIQEDMMRTVDPLDANLVAYYRFDNKGSDAVADLSSSNNSASLKNIDTDLAWQNSESFNTWLGTISQDWNNAGNWTDGVPDAGDNVGIYKRVDGNNVEISGNPCFNNLYIASGATPGLMSNISVDGHLLLNSNLYMNGDTISIGPKGKLIEENGNISGASGIITTTRTLEALSSENVGGLGMEITTASVMGNTTIIRSQSKLGTSGIGRHYHIIPTNNTGLNANLLFHYSDSELEGANESELKLFKSEDGSSWIEQLGSTVNTIENTIELSGVDGFSYWTAAPTGTGGALPVELTAFSASASEGKIALTWETTTERNNYGFEIERALSEEKAFEKIGFVEGYGNSNSIKTYSFADSNPAEGKAFYRLKQIDFDGKYEYSKEIELTYESVKEFALEQNYPNPFNPTTNISFKLAVSGKVNVKIYNSIGQEVAELVNRTMEAGKHEVTFNASNLPSGTYFCRMTAGSFTKTSKMLLIK